MTKSIKKKTSPDEFFIVQKDDYIGIDAVSIILEQMRALTMLSTQTSNDFCKEVIESMMLSMVIQCQKLCDALEMQERKS